MVPCQAVFVLTHFYSVLSGEATNTNFIIFGLTRQLLEPTIYSSHGEHVNKLSDIYAICRASGMLLHINGKFTIGEMK